MAECQGPQDCHDGQPFCTEDDCDLATGICVYTPVEDGTECYGGSFLGVCVSGVCRQECENDTGCNDFNVCTVDACDPVDGFCEDYTPAADGTPCGDLSVCIGGTCRHFECEVDADCSDFKDCTMDNCDCTTDICYGFGFCAESLPVQDGGPCAGGLCQDGECALQGSVLPCTEQGIRNAIAAGGGPYAFDCDGPTSVVTEAEIVIDNDVIVDGEGNLIVDGNTDHEVFFVGEGITAELHGFAVTNASVSGIRNSGTLTLTDSTVSGNFDSGITNLGTLMLTDSTVSGNSGVYGGIYNDGTLTLTHSIVSGNTASVDGGGIQNFGTLTLTNSTVSGNTSYFGGGGIRNSGTLTLTNSTVSGNTVNLGGGGIYNEDPGGTATLTNSTVSDNASYDIAGGIINVNSGTLTLTNSTVSGNSADLGGGIYNATGGKLTLTNSTVSRNTAMDFVHGIYNHDGGGESTVTNTLIDNDCAGTIVSDGNNLESPGDTCGLDQLSDQPGVTAEQLNLGPLADNGGPTMTQALGAGSVAIDKIPEAECVDADGAPLTTDQRGVTRPQGPACDIGAFELEVGP
jgi:hypothetical protein